MGWCTLVRALLMASSRLMMFERVWTVALCGVCTPLIYRLNCVLKRFWELVAISTL